MGTRTVEGRRVETSKEDKILFPDAGLTKGDVLDYYERIAPRMVPHLEGRPLTLQRFPDGIGGGDGFYQKQVPDHFPDWVPRVEVALRSGGRQTLVVCDDAATLVYLANQACLTFHPWLSRRGALDHPDELVVDLDPDDGGFQRTRAAALTVRELLTGELVLPTFPKLTGSRGVHVVVPLDGEAGFDAVRELARRAMDALADRHPETLTTEQRKDARGGRLYLDVARNAYGQTAVAPWSLRPLPGAPIAAPIPWGDLEADRVDARSYHPGNVFRSLGQRDDPWRGFGDERGSVARAAERLSQIV